MITFDDFQKLDIRVGTIIEAVRVPGADKLLQLKVDFGLKPRSGSPDHESDVGLNSKLAGRGAGSLDHSAMQNDLGDKKNIRQIVSGIAEYYAPEDLINRQAPFVVNLELRTFRGVESQGMILAADNDGGVALLHPDRHLPPGSRVR